MYQVLATNVYRTGTTDLNGKVTFSYSNLAILKINADKGNYHGEGLLILEYDQQVSTTIILDN